MNLLKSITFSLLGALMALAFSAAPAQAQATRTWVSGVGDDVNPCSRTAPCKTFAGAISKTAAGGEINCLDPAGYGAVTINKSLVIDCHFTEGGALAAGNGIVVNAASTDVVVLRGLDIFGVSPPTNGVRILVAAAVHIEDCVIRRFNLTGSDGVSFAPSVSSKLYISNTTITENGGGGTGGGIEVKPTAGATASVVLNNVRVEHNNGTNGLRLDSTSGAIAAMVNGSDFSGNGQGIAVVTTGAFSNLSLVNQSTIASNTTGIVANGSVRVRVKNSIITNNGTGVNPAGGSFIDDLGGNALIGNTTDGAFN